MTDNGKEIGVAILKVMEEVGYVQKEQAGSLQYTILSEAALIAALRPSMIQHGIFCYVTDLPQIGREEFTTKNGINMNRATAHGIVRFMHPESGSSIMSWAISNACSVASILSAQTSNSWAGTWSLTLARKRTSLLRAPSITALQQRVHIFELLPNVHRPKRP